MAYPVPRADGESWASALAFWSALLLAGLLLATVLLAPKAKTLAELGVEYATNQVRLVELERRAIELEEVAEALREDPSFAAELARMEFAAGQPGEERISIPADLRLVAAKPSQSIPAAPVNRGWQFPAALLELVASSAWLRRTLLVLAATLVLGAFLLCSAEAGVQVVSRHTHRLAGGVSRRYRKT